MRTHVMIALAGLMVVGCFMPDGDSGDDHLEAKEPAYSIDADFPLAVLRLEFNNSSGELGRLIRVQNVSDQAIQGFRYTLWAYNRFDEPVRQHGFGDSFTSHYTQDDIGPMGTGTIRGSEYGFDGARSIVFMFLSYYVNGEEVFCGGLGPSWSPPQGPHDPCSIYLEVEN